MEIWSVMSGVYTLSTTVEITFILPKLYLKKSTKVQLNFPNSIFPLCEKLRVRLHVTEMKSHPGMKKILFTSEFHLGMKRVIFHPGMKRVVFHPGMKFKLQENLLSMKNL